MVEEDKYCIDIIKQVEAVQAALDKINEIILENHLHTCVTTAIRGDDPERREAVIGEILGVFSVSKK
jgi:DNA-binding FrmR family transcriptional regulator